MQFKESSHAWYVVYLWIIRDEDLQIGHGERPIHSITQPVPFVQYWLTVAPLLSSQYPLCPQCIHSFYLHILSSYFPICVMERGIPNAAVKPLLGHCLQHSRCFDSAVLSILCFFFFLHCFFKVIRTTWNELKIIKAHLFTLGLLKIIYFYFFKKIDSYWN